MPTGGDGVYYFSIYFEVDSGEAAGFSMRLNNDVICTTWPDHSNNGDGDYPSGSCSAVVNVVAGNLYFKCVIIMNFKISLKFHRIK